MRHVVWDWNGTLFDDLDIVVAAVNVSLRAVGAGPIDADRYREVYQRPLHRFYETLLGRPVLPEEMASIDLDFHDAYHALLDQARLTVDARRAVDLVAARGQTQSVLSMWWHDRLVPAVRYFALDDYMLAVDGHRGPAGASKQNHLARHVEQLVRLFPGRVEGRSMTVIGDVTDDADAARAVGVGCVLYDGGSQPRAALEATGAPVASSLIEAVELAAAE
ncbi:MAG: HAD hydrolase-like protein [Acidimicrobiia bacterium]|nr:HAD hydrolase-like protein [Acidimicrobiia bacterium]